LLRKTLVALCAGLLTVQGLFAAPNFPFPQNQGYGSHVTIPDNADHNHVQAAYEIFLKNYYEEQGDQARIKWDEPDKTVSEGIAYGMIAMVYMDNEKNNTQAKFDKLWKYYNNHLDPQGLMHWKISGFGGTIGANAATDADLDAAFALALAYFQWKDDKYKNAATDMMKKIYRTEVVNGNMLKPGSDPGFFDPKNPSYFAFIAMELFAKLGWDGNNWSNVISGCYAFMKKAQNGTTGLMGDWCDNNGNPTAQRGPLTDHYGFDGARIPWRLGWAYCWYSNHSDAKSISNNMSKWIATTKTNGDPSLIPSIINVATGVAQSAYNLPTYIGPYACGAMVDPTYKTWLNACYDRLATFIDNDNYYNQSLKVLSLLVLTGNGINFSTAQPKTAFTIKTAMVPANSGTITVSPQKATYTRGEKVTVTATPNGQNKFVNWTGDATSSNSSMEVTVLSDMKLTAFFNAGDGDLLDNCEDNDHLTRVGSAWIAYNDVSEKGLSTITPLTTPTKFFTMSDGGANGSSKCAKITYSLNQGGNKYNPFVGVGFNLDKDTSGKTAVDISTASSLTFYYKGDTCDVRIETKNITDFGYYFVRVPASKEWKLVTLQWSQFAQAIWAVKADFDRKQATKIAWQTPNTAKTGMAGTISIDEIHLPGYVVKTGVKPAAIRHDVTSFSISNVSSKSMSVAFNLSEKSNATVGIYELSGKLVNSIALDIRQAGRYTETVNLANFNLTNGTYLIKLNAGKQTWSERFTYLK
jgi:endo-1,4-beta-D-glucanase Y